MQEQVFEEDEIGGLRINVVSADQVEFLLPLGKHVINSRDRLLVDCFRSVENVFGQLFALVLHGIEEKTVVFFENREHRFATYRRPAAEGDSNFVFLEKLFGFLREE